MPYFLEQGPRPQVQKLYSTVSSAMSQIHSQIQLPNKQKIIEKETIRESTIMARSGASTGYTRCAPTSQHFCIRSAEGLSPQRKGKAAQERASGTRAGFLAHL